MKISGANNVQNVMKAYGTNKTEKLQKITMKEDKIEISQAGKDYAVAMEAFKNLPEVREAKINEIKDRISSGNYSVDSEALAKAIMNNDK